VRLSSGEVAQHKRPIVTDGRSSSGPGGGSAKMRAIGGARRLRLV
jgi:hypothetical protein